MDFQKTPLKDVARALGASEQTVSNVINATGVFHHVAVSDRGAVREAELVNWMLNHQVAGILLSAADKGGVAQQTAGRFGVRCIAIMNRGPRAAQDYVGADNRAGARLAIEHLIGLGHRRIGHVRSLPSHTGNERAEGYAEALAAHGIPVDPHLTGSGDYSRKGASAAIPTLLARAPDIAAVFCSSSLMAYGVLDAVGALGRRVPETLSVVGFDFMAFSSLGPIGLTSVAYDSFNLATLALRRLTDCIADRSMMAVPYQVILPCSLVLRGSAVHLTETP